MQKNKKVWLFYIYKDDYITVFDEHAFVNGRDKKAAMYIAAFVNSIYKYGNLHSRIYKLHSGEAFRISFLFRC